MVPRPLSRPHHLLGRLYPQLWRACTGPHSRVSTLAIAPDQTRREGRHEVQKLRHQHATSTHTCSATRSQLHEAAQWVGPDTAQPLTPISDHLRATTAPSAHRGAPGAPSRPKSMVTAQEDRVEDGLPSVEVAHVVELVGIRDGECPPRRAPVELAHLGRVEPAGAAPETQCTTVDQRLLR